jgi:hypothetical protein
MEILAVYIEQISISLIGIYHPFWGQVPQHSATIHAIRDVCDFCSIKLPYKIDPSRPGTVIAGDFNDLSHHMQVLCDEFHLTPLVNVLTRGLNCLYQVYTDISQEFANVLPNAPLGRSDHVAVAVKASVRPEPIIQKKLIHKITPAGIDKMGEMLQSTQWEEIVSPDLSLDEATELLVATLDSIFVYGFPKKVIHMRTIDKP